MLVFGNSLRFEPQPLAKLCVWGLVRPARTAVSVAIQFRPGTTGAFKRIATARTRSRPDYFVSARVK